MLHCWHQMSIVGDDRCCNRMRWCSTFNSAINWKEGVVFAIILTLFGFHSIWVLHRRTYDVIRSESELRMVNLVRQGDLSLVWCGFFFGEDFAQNLIISNDNFLLFLLLLDLPAPEILNQYILIESIYFKLNILNQYILIESIYFNWINIF